MPGQEVHRERSRRNQSGRASFPLGLECLAYKYLSPQAYDNSCLVAKFEKSCKDFRGKWRIDRKGVVLREEREQQ